MQQTGYRLYDINARKMTQQVETAPGTLITLGWAGPNAILVAEQQDDRWWTVCLQPLNGKRQPLYHVVM
jgi:hypothetical protein